MTLPCGCEVTWWRGIKMRLLLACGLTERFDRLHGRFPIGWTGTLCYRDGHLISMIRRTFHKPTPIGVAIDASFAEMERHP